MFQVNAEKTSDNTNQAAAKALKNRDKPRDDDRHGRTELRIVRIIGSSSDPKKSINTCVLRFLARWCGWLPLETFQVKRLFSGSSASTEMGVLDMVFKAVLRRF